MKLKLQPRIAAFVLTTSFLTTIGCILYFRTHRPPQTQTLTKAPIQNQPSLYFAPALAANVKATGKYLTSNLVMKPGGKNIQTISVQLGYDTKAMTSVKLIPEKLKNPPYQITENRVDAKNGTISYILIKNPNYKGPEIKSAMRIARVYYKVTSSSKNTILSFLPRTGLYTNTPAIAATKLKKSTLNTLYQADPTVLGNSVLTQVVPLNIVSLPKPSKAPKK